MLGEGGVGAGRPRRPGARPHEPAERDHDRDRDRDQERQARPPRARPAPAGARPGQRRLTAEHAVEVVAQLERAGVARVGRLGHGDAPDCHQVRRRRHDLGRPLGLHLDHAREQRHEGAFVERRSSGERREQHRPEAVDVDARVGRRARVAHGLLGRHEGGRPQQLARAREPPRVAVARDPEVEEHGRAVRPQEDVVGLEVAVDDPLRVHGPQRVGERAEHLGRAARLERRAAVGERGHGAERPALDQLRDQVGPVGRAPELMHEQHVRMPDLGQRLRLALEPGQGLDVGLAGDRQLERERPRDGGVAHLEHDAHGAAPELAHDLVGPDAPGSRHAWSIVSDPTRRRGHRVPA